MNKVPTKAMHYITIEGCRFETILRYNPSTDYIGITTTRRGNYTAGRDKRAEYAKHRYNHDATVRTSRLTSNEKWHNDHPDYMPDYLKVYKAEHKEESKQRDHAYYESHKEQSRVSNEQWREANKGHLQQYRRDNPREKRDYVFSPPLCIKLNQPFQGSVGHHLMTGVMIYIPEEMNKGTLHNIKTGKGMYDINSQAINYLVGSI